MVGALEDAVLVRDWAAPRPRLAVNPMPLSSAMQRLRTRSQRPQALACAQKGPYLLAVRGNIRVQRAAHAATG